MGISEYIISCINEKREITKLSDAQGQFLELFDIAYKRSSDPSFKREMALLNKVNFNLLWLIRTQNTFMKQLKIPQNKDDVITTYVDHPILSIAHEEALKEIRKLRGTNTEDVNQ